MMMRYAAGVIALLLLAYPALAYAQAIIINEVELFPSFREESQWIELYNLSSSPIDLSGWTVTSQAKNMTITIPEGTVINGTGYIIIDNDEQWMELEDEMLTLRDRHGRRSDRVGPFTELSKDSATWQRYPNAEDTWRFIIKSPGKTNGGFPVAPKEFTTTLAVERFTITNFSLIEAGGAEVTKIDVQRPLIISTKITNNTVQKHSFSYITQIKNADGITVELSWIVAAIEERTDLKLAQVWIPEAAGTYEIEVFVWESVANPSPLVFDLPSAMIDVEEI